MSAIAVPANVAGQHQRQVHRAIVQRCVKVVIDSFANMNGNRMPGLGGLPDVRGKATDQMSGCSRNLFNGLLVVVPEMPPVHFHDRHHFDFSAASELNLIRSVQRGVDGHVHSDIVAADERNPGGGTVPYAEVADGLSLILLQALDTV